MYIISLILFVLITIGISILSAEPKVFIDIPSLLVIVGLTLPLIFASGLFNDFIRGFAIMNHTTNKYTAIELKRSLEAMKLAMTGIILSGILGTLVAFVAICHGDFAKEMLMPYLGVASLTTLYALVFLMILLPIISRIKSILYTLE